MAIAIVMVDLGVVGFAAADNDSTGDGGDGVVNRALFFEEASC